MSNCSFDKNVIQSSPQWTESEPADCLHKGLIQILKPQTNVNEY